MHNDGNLPLDYAEHLGRVTVVLLRVDPAGQRQPANLTTPVVRHTHSHRPMLWQQTERRAVGPGGQRVTFSSVIG
jgi:hypothetical protein